MYLCLYFANITGPAEMRNFIRVITFCQSTCRQVPSFEKKSFAIKQFGPRIVVKLYIYIYISTLVLPAVEYILYYAAIADAYLMK